MKFNKKITRNLIILTLVFFVNNFVIGKALAAENFGFGFYQPQDPALITAPAPEEVETISLSNADFDKTQAIDFFVDKLSVTIPEKFIADASELTVKKITQDNTTPWSLDRISPIYEINFSPTFGFDAKNFLSLNLSYDQANNYFKQVYYFDAVTKVWRALPSTDFPQTKKIKAALNKTALKVAVFANPAVLTVGKASWYKYKGGLFTASPDFPKGSKLRVTNLANNKSVEVVVNDWGPDRAKHPDRVVDLDKVAFAAIADTGDGVIDVSVSPISLASDSSGRVLGVKAEGVTSQPTLASRSVVIMNEATGEVLLDKNSDLNLPLASLTKIVATSVFLSTNPDMDQKVVYKTQDETYNNLYVDPGESAKVRLSDNEQVTVKDLFYSALVGSANNAVESLVRLSGLSRDAFVQKMNDQVKLWGATQTNFVEPTGLSNRNVSSAMDYAMIMKMALQNNLIAEATTTAVYKFTTGSGIAHTIKNTNKLIADQAQANLQAEKYPITASKTGYLVEAGYCLATRVRAGDGNYIIVTLNAPTREKSFNEMADLIKYLGRII